MSDILPAIFFRHGNPMNALSTNPYMEGCGSISMLSVQVAAPAP